MNEGRIEIGHRWKEECEVFMQSGDTNMNVPKPLVIHLTRNVTTYMPQGFQPVILKAPSSFLYDNNKAVPWRYDVQVSKGRQDVSLLHDGHNASTPKVTNISGISGMTRSGRVFTYPDFRAELKDMVRKEYLLKRQHNF